MSGVNATEPFQDTRLPGPSDEHTDSALSRDEDYLDRTTLKPNIQRTKPNDIQHTRNPERAENRDPLQEYNLRLAKEAALYNPRKRWQRQKRQRGRQRMKDRRRYLKNRRQTLTRAKRRYRRIKNHPRFKMLRERRLKHPNRHKRKPASEVLVNGEGVQGYNPDFEFAIGPNLDIGVVHNLDSGTGMVTFETTDGVEQLPAPNFMASVVFFSEEDIEAMFEFMDEADCQEVYDELEPEDIHGTAELFGIPWDDDEDFMSKSEELTGKRHLDNMNEAELEIIEAAILEGQFHGGWYEYPEEQELPAYWLTAGRWVEDKGDDWGNKLEARPDQPGEPDNHRNIPERDTQSWPPASSKVVPDHFDWPTRTAATIDEILSKTGQDVHERARSIHWSLARADRKNAIWTFRVQGSQGTYKVRVKGVRKGTTKKMSTAQVKVSCTCNFFRWQGPEHWARTNRYLYGRPAGTATKPVVKDPKGQHWACKHIVKVLEAARRYRMASEDGMWSYDAEFIPDFEIASRVASRYLLEGYGSVEGVPDADL